MPIQRRDIFFSMQTLDLLHRFLSFFEYLLLESLLTVFGSCLLPTIEI